MSEQTKAGHKAAQKVGGVRVKEHAQKPKNDTETPVTGIANAFSPKAEVIMTNTSGVDQQIDPKKLGDPKDMPHLQPKPSNNPKGGKGAAGNPKKIQQPEKFNNQH
mmetsp:Transcript_7445/g.13009  ORF Transcript_7445/g.13009 Transcript_7445/m.13009 type:complete len:106 (-) Transcript_7445:34-351(-)